MIESSKYLTNADMISRLGNGHDNVGGLKADQRDIRNWLLQRLHVIGFGLVDRRAGIGAGDHAGQI
jgi:hypothetical protein